MFHFYSNMAVQGIEYGGGYDTDDGYRGNLCLLDTKGNITKIKIPKDCGWNWKESDLNNGYYVMYEYLSDYFVIFNLSNNTFKKMPEEYFTKIDYEKLPSPLEFSDDRIALPLIGSDDKYYIALFNNKWEMVSEPIQVENLNNYTYSEGRLIIFDNYVTKVYDKDSNEIFDSSKIGYTQLSKYKNGVSKIDNESIPTYIDKDGKRIFEAIDTSIMN